MPPRLKVGSAVMRELEGMLFPARIVGVDDDGTFTIRYTDDGNVEEGVDEEELELDDSGGGDYKAEEDGKEEEGKRAEGKEEDGDLIGDDVLKSRDQLKRPETAKVTKHSRKSSSMETDDGANALIINGLESNFAAGKGVKGIRWLRQNPSND